MWFTFSVDTLAIRSRGLIKSGSMKRSFFPGSCVTKRRRKSEHKVYNNLPNSKDTQYAFCCSQQKQDHLRLVTLLLFWVTYCQQIPRIDYNLVCLKPSLNTSLPCLWPIGVKGFSFFRLKIIWHRVSPGVRLQILHIWIGTPLCYPLCTDFAILLGQASTTTSAKKTSWAPWNLLH